MSKVGVGGGLLGLGVHEVCYSSTHTSKNNTLRAIVTPVYIPHIQNRTF